MMVCAGLTALLVGTCLYNIGWKPRALEVFHSLGLIPQWTFFAPQPGVQNLYLLYRDIYSGGESSSWRMLNDMDASRLNATCIWNPRRRLRKALFDLIITLASEASDVQNEALKLSAPYLLILNHLSLLPRFRGVWAVQFMIMVSDPHQTPKLAFQSQIHRI